MSEIRWRNPKKEWPQHDQLVFVMLEAHKPRGTFVKSAASVEIVGGWANWVGSKCFIENNDELGHGAISWILLGDDEGYDTRAVAWIPAEEMPVPEWGRW